MKVSADLLQEAEGALERGGGYYQVAHLVQAIQKGEMQSWVRGRSWVVTHILDFPCRRVVEVVLAVGDLEDVYALESDVEQFALEQGARSLIAFGRPGWDKAHSKGWIKVSHRFERVL